MKNPFNIQKDIKQIKETGKEIEKKAPLVNSVVKSIFVIIKWVVLVVAILVIILFLASIIGDKIAEKKRQQRNFCSEKCNYSFTLCNQKSRTRSLLFPDWDEKCPNTPEEIECFRVCMGAPSFKGIKIPDF